MQSLKKKFVLLSAIFVVLCVAGVVTCAQLNEEIGGGIYVNDMPVTTAPMILNGVTYVPLRAVAETLGARVVWYAETGRIDIKPLKKFPDAQELKPAMSEGTQEDTDKLAVADAPLKFGNTPAQVESALGAPTRKVLMEMWQYNDSFVSFYNGKVERWSTNPDRRFEDVLHVGTWKFVDMGPITGKGTSKGSPAPRSSGRR
jgi:hypothetical protein